MIDQELFEDYKQNPTIEKRNALVEKNLYMVDILIRKYLSKGVEYDDLYQIGALALVAAVERFDPAKGFEFSSFATPTILGEIKKYFRDKQWSLKVPRRLKEIAAKVQDAKDKLNSKLHRTPTVAEIAEFTGYTEEQIIEAIESSHAFLEKYTGFNEHGYDQIETAEIINKVVNTFNDQYKFIFRERFINNKSQSEIAKSLGISQMTVSRAEKNIVGKFRAELFR